MIDMDGDGLISYDEYIFFNTLLTGEPAAKESMRTGQKEATESLTVLRHAVSTKDLHLAFQMFDENLDKALNASEFDTVSSHLEQRCNYLEPVL